MFRPFCFCCGKADIAEATEKGRGRVLPLPAVLRKGSEAQRQRREAEKRAKEGPKRDDRNRQQNNSNANFNSAGSMFNTFR